MKSRRRRRGDIIGDVKIGEKEEEKEEKEKDKTEEEKRRRG